MRLCSVAASSIGFLTQYWPMVSIASDETTLNALLAMGGEQLRVQLLHDLSRIESRIWPPSSAPSSGAAMSPEMLRRLLHEMRGIALTVGATTLAQACAEAEASTLAMPVAEMSSQLGTITTDSQTLRAQIAQHTMTPT